MDDLGPRPQRGIEMLQHEIDALTMKHGITSGRDDVSGAELLPEWVAQARQADDAISKTWCL